MPLCYEFAGYVENAIIRFESDVHHKFWLAVIVIASVAARGCSSNIDVAHQSGFRDALYPGWRFSHRDRLLWARFVGCQRGNRQADLRQ